LRGVLTALALYDPYGAPAAGDAPVADAAAALDADRHGRRLREIRIPLA
jgi:hypothetical protein